MDWKDIKDTVGNVAPMLGSLVAGKAGEKLGSILASVLGCEPTPEAVEKAIKADPEAAVKLAEIEKDQKVRLQELVVQDAANTLTADTARIQSVNETMQAEGQSEHWQTYSWRPAIGFAVAIDFLLTGLIILIAYGAAMFGYVEVLQHLPGLVGSMAGLVTSSLPILGVASYFRGKMQADSSKC